MLIPIIKNRGIAVLSGTVILGVIAVINMDYLMVTAPLYFLAFAHKEITSTSVEVQKKQKKNENDYVFLFLWLNIFSGVAILIYAIIGCINDPPQYIEALKDCMNTMYWFFIMFIPPLIFSFRKPDKKKSENAAFLAKAKKLRVIYILSMITFVEEIALYYMRGFDHIHIVYSLFVPWMVYACLLIICDDDPVIAFFAQEFKRLVDKLALIDKVKEK